MPLHETSQRVQDLLRSRGFDIRVLEFPQGTKTSKDAAAALGCSVSQIAKSIVFRLAPSDRACLVITSGSNRVDVAKVEKLVGETVEKADADFVKQKTGYVIGGVAPVCHSEPCEILIDEDLLTYELVYGAAGTPFAVFEMTSAQLVEMSGGQVADVKE